MTTRHLSTSLGLALVAAAGLLAQTGTGDGTPGFGGLTGQARPESSGTGDGGPIRNNEDRARIQALMSEIDQLAASLRQLYGAKQAAEEGAAARKGEVEGLQQAIASREQRARWIAQSGFAELTRERQGLEATGRTAVDRRNAALRELSGAGGTGTGNGRRGTGTGNGTVGGLQGDLPSLQQAVATRDTEYAAAVRRYDEARRNYLECERQHKAAASSTSGTGTGTSGTGSSGGTGAGTGGTGGTGTGSSSGGTGTGSGTGAGTSGTGTGSGTGTSSTLDCSGTSFGTGSGTGSGSSGTGSGKTDWRTEMDRLRRARDEAEGRLQAATDAAARANSRIRELERIVASATEVIDQVERGLALNDGKGRGYQQELDQRPALDEAARQRIQAALGERAAFEAEARRLQTAPDGIQALEQRKAADEAELEQFRTKYLDLTAEALGAARGFHEFFGGAQGLGFDKQAGQTAPLIQSVRIQLLGSQDWVQLPRLAEVVRTGFQSYVDDKKGAFDALETQRRTLEQALSALQTEHQRLTAAHQAKVQELAAARREVQAAQSAYDSGPSRFSLSSSKRKQASDNKDRLDRAQERLKALEGHDPTFGARVKGEVEVAKEAADAKGTQVSRKQDELRAFMPGHERAKANLDQIRAYQTSVREGLDQEGTLRAIAQVQGML